MAEKYSGKVMDRRYKGDAVDITYSLKRCIHAEQCIHNLSAVFDKNRRPWIITGAASADEVARVVPLCPSGALHFEGKNGSTESIPEVNRILLWEHGPLQVHGEVEVSGSTVELQGETRATLCRCGGSANKPFCDNAHLTNDFQAPDVTMEWGEETNRAGGKLHITVEANGPYLVSGEVTIINAAGAVIFSGSEVWLCRCGGSSNKPFCDSTHERIGFQAE